MRISERSALLTFVIIAAVVLPIRLLAHAVLVESNPPAGATVRGPNLPVSLRFNVRVDGSRSRCSLVMPDASSRTIALDKQTRPDVLSASVTGLAAGKYKLQWQVLAADGHISRGELTFLVE